MTEHEIQRRILVRDVCHTCNRAPKHVTRSGTKTHRCANCWSDYKAAHRKIRPGNMTCPACKKRPRHKYKTAYIAFCQPCWKLKQRARYAARKLTANELLQRKAEQVVRHLRKQGKIIPTPCVHCGAEKAWAHHPDYSRLDFVIFLCRPCHTEEHKRMRREARERVASTL